MMEMLIFRAFIVLVSFLIALIFLITFKEAYDMDGKFGLFMNGFGFVFFVVIATATIIGNYDYYKIDVNDSINSSTIAFYKLNIIAKAWNKFDDFKPDYTDVLQPKWQPSFTIERNKKGINELTIAEMCLTYVDFGNFYGKYICFRSRNIAELFSKTFVNLFHMLYNECF